MLSTYGWGGTFATSRSRGTRTTSYATAAARKGHEHYGAPWRPGSQPAGWFSIRKRRSSSTARIQTDVVTFRTTHSTFSVTRFDRERRAGAAVNTAFHSCPRPVRKH